jgi:hypothetical protein
MKPDRRERLIMSGESSERHVLDGRFPQGRQFLQELDKWCRLLAECCGGCNLDYSLQSLTRIEEYVCGHFGAEDRVSSPIFPAMTAYIGEIIRRRVSGAWKIQHTGIGDLWEPFVSVSGSDQIYPFMIIYESLYEEELVAGEVGSLFGAVIGTIAYYGGDLLDS